VSQVCTERGVGKLGDVVNQVTQMSSARCKRWRVPLSPLSGVAPDVNFHACALERRHQHELALGDPAGWFADEWLISHYVIAVAAVVAHAACGLRVVLLAHGIGGAHAGALARAIVSVAILLAVGDHGRNAWSAFRPLKGAHPRS
jgi:hypothetical protein